MKLNVVAKLASRFRRQSLGTWNGCRARRSAADGDSEQIGFAPAILVDASRAGGDGGGLLSIFVGTIVTGSASAAGCSISAGASCTSVGAGGSGAVTILSLESDGCGEGALSVDFSQLVSCMPSNSASNRPNCRVGRAIARDLRASSRALQFTNSSASRSAAPTQQAATSALYSNRQTTCDNRGRAPSPAPLASAS